MGSLSRFMGKPKKIDLFGTEVTINPIKVKDMLEFSVNNPTPEQSAQMARRMIQLSIPDTTEEELDNMPLEVFTKLLEEINEFNGFTDERAARAAKLTPK